MEQGTHKIVSNYVCGNYRSEIFHRTSFVGILVKVAVGSLEYKQDCGKWPP